MAINSTTLEFHINSSGESEFVPQKSWYISRHTIKIHIQILSLSIVDLDVYTIPGGINVSGEGSYRVLVRWLAGTSSESGVRSGQQFCAAPPN
jgi:hypothetical protein